MVPLNITMSALFATCFLRTSLQSIQLYNVMYDNVDMQKEVGILEKNKKRRNATTQGFQRFNQVLM